jgi:prevent-host-death family protein
MKTATIRELKHETSRVLGWAEAGESVQVSRRGKVAVIISAPTSRVRSKRPDFIARLAAVYGDTALGTTATDVICGARGER